MRPDICWTAWIWARYVCTSVCPHCPVTSLPSGNGIPLTVQGMTLPDDREAYDAVVYVCLKPSLLAKLLENHRMGDVPIERDCLRMFKAFPACKTAWTYWVGGMPTERGSIMSPLSVSRANNWPTPSLKDHDIIILFSCRSVGQPSTINRPYGRHEADRETEERN